MALNSRIAASSQNRMIRSTTSVESNNSTDRMIGERPPEGPGGDNSPSQDDTVSPVVTRILPDHVTNDIQERSTDSPRYWFPSVTAWYGDLNKAHAITVILLCYCNLINYMDRSTVAGMISFIKEDKHFNVKDDKRLGLLQV